MDWSMGSTKHCGLRRRRFFKRKWVYVAAIGVDFLGHLAGTYTLVPDGALFHPSSDAYVSAHHKWHGHMGMLSPSSLVKYFTAFFEVFRRAVWSIFKLENVQLQAIDESGQYISRHVTSWKAKRYSHKSGVVQVAVFVCLFLAVALFVLVGDDLALSQS